MRRRAVLRWASGGAVGLVASTTACASEAPVTGDRRPSTRAAADRLTAGRSSHGSEGPSITGTVELRGLAGHAPALAHVPSTAAATAVPLVVMLHGAGGRPARSVRLLRDLAERDGFSVLAPKSLGATWDRVLGSFGPDVRNIDALVQDFSRRVPVARVALAGFSDGASYALSLGLGNGDLLDAVIAFSPGFAAPAVRRGRPPVYVSHGVDDRVLPIDRCSRRLVPVLQDEGYEVTYREFTGGHEVPEEVRDEASRWLSEQR